jgi:fido (protein-threonine AMPylation protein)
MANMSNREKFDWEHRIKYLLKDSFEPKTHEAYKLAASLGIDRARVVIMATAEVVPTLDTIREVHRVSFRDVYKDAGQFRTFGREIAIGREGERGAYYSQIVDELTLLSKQNSELLETAASREDKARAIAFYHLRYVKIHPFMDGNGRSGRVIANMQSEALLEKRLQVDFDHKVYIKGIKTAFREKDLGPLTKILTGVELNKELSKSPYPLALNEIVIVKEVPGGKNLNVKCGDDVEMAQEVEEALLTPRLVTALRLGEKVEIKLKESTRHERGSIDIDQVREQSREMQR